MKRYIILLALAFVNFCSFGQIDTTITLISKIDAFPQFQLPDNNEIYMMGYTQLIGAPIDIPAPTLNFTEGDSVQLNLWNLSQGAPHTIHLHGLDVDQANDGVPALSYTIPHDDTGSYIFEAPHAGTYIYHCHETSVLHVQAGMYGLVIVRPQSADTLTWDGGYSFHREYAWMTSEIDTNWHHDSIINHPPPDTTTGMHTILDYYPQFFMVNGRSNQQLVGSPSEIQGSLGETLYLRLANIGYYGNTFIFPSELNAVIVASDGRPLPSSETSDTLVIFPGERYGVLFEPTSLFTDFIQVDYFSLNTGNTVNSQYVTANIEGYLGAPEELGQEIKVYPNPTNGQLSVELPGTDGSVKEISITNMLGQTIIEKRITDEKISIDMSDMKSGTYLLNINYLHTTTSKLIIKN